MPNTRDIDTGFAAALAGLKRLDGAARVGALDEENAKKLNWNEFGTVVNGEPHVPPRATLTTTTDNLRGAIDRAVDKRVGAVLDGRDRLSTGREIMADVGEDLAEEVQNAIDGNTPPALAPSTATSRRRRGKDERTLVDSGDMRRSIKVETSDDPDAWLAEEFVF